MKKEHLPCKACDETRPIYEDGICLRCSKLRKKKPILKKENKDFNGSLSPATYKHDGL